MREFDKNYTELATHGPYTAWESKKDIDNLWDNFLNSNRDGQHEQTSRWALIKKMDGWENARIIITNNTNIAGGYQVLFKPKKIVGNVGYISKGPIIINNDDSERVTDFIVKTICRLAKKEKIRLLIIQPPDYRSDLSDVFKRKGFQPNYFEGLFSNATQRISLNKPEEELLRDMKRQKRQNINKSIKNGVIVREGNESELAIFYKYMILTCQRQNAEPNPSRCDILNLMWELFYPIGNIKLFLAEYQDEIVSAIVTIPFNETVYFWKFGWSGKYGKFRPNDLLYWEIMKWAKNNGYKNVDLVSVSFEMAKKVSESTSRSKINNKGSSFFKLGFGGEMLVLPVERVYIYNKILAFYYKASFYLLNAHPRIKNKVLTKLQSI